MRFVPGQKPEQRFDIPISAKLYPISATDYGADFFIHDEQERYQFPKFETTSNWPSLGTALKPSHIRGRLSLEDIGSAKIKHKVT